MLSHKDTIIIGITAFKHVKGEFLDRDMGLPVKIYTH